MFSLFLRSRDYVNNDGGFWLLLVDGLLLIPLAMAAFFYPRQVLIGVGIVLLAAAVAYEAYVYWRRRSGPRMRA